MKVAYFDYWTRGTHHFTGIDPALRRHGCQTVFMHIGSFREPCVPEEVVDGIVCRDITFYGTRLVHEMLRRERPDVVVTLNTSTLMDRAVVSAARSLGIRTVHLMHGALMGADEPDKAVEVENWRFQIFSVKARKLGKYASKIIPNYLYSSFKGNRAAFFRGTPFRVMWRFGANPGRELTFPSFPDDCVHDRALVYSESDVKLFQKMGYPRDRIMIVGNPKYDTLLRRLQENAFTRDQLPQDLRAKIGPSGRYAVIVDDGLPNDWPVFGWTHEYRNRFFDDVSAALERNGYSSVIKLHPGTRRNDVRKPQRESAFLYQKGVDLDALIYFSDFCVCHVSTVINNCVLLDKPVLTPRWGPSAPLPDLKIRQGIVSVWNSLDEPLNPVIDCERREKYKRTHITVMTPSSIDSVVGAILSLGHTA